VDEIIDSPLTDLGAQSITEQGVQVLVQQQDQIAEATSGDF